MLLYMLYAFSFSIDSLLWVYLRISYATFASSDTGVYVFKHIYSKAYTYSLFIVASFQSWLYNL